MSPSDASITYPLDIARIITMLPHRYPFLLVDRVIACEPHKSLTAVKNVTFNEPFFQGHFPGHPVMPGVLVIEAMAQASGLLTQLSQSQPGGPSIPLYYLVKVDKAEDKFDKFVTMLQVKYGFTRQQARDEVNRLWTENQAKNKIMKA